MDDDAPNSLTAAKTEATAIVENLHTDACADVAQDELYYSIDSWEPAVSSHGKVKKKKGKKYQLNQ